MVKKKKHMQWEVRDLPGGRWGVFLKQEFCKTEEPVCYGACHTPESAARSVERLNKESIETAEQN